MKHWIFDLDGTLVDSFALYFEALTAIFKGSGKAFGPELRLPALSEYLPDFFEKHLGHRAVANAMIAIQARGNEDARRVIPFSGIIPLIEELVRSGSRIAVWTNRDRVSTELILQHSGLQKYVDICITRTCVSKPKPDSEGLLRILERFDCGPDAVTMVGDHEYDVEAAKIMGVRSVRAGWHGYWKMDRCLRADHQFESVEAFCSWVRGQVPSDPVSLRAIRASFKAFCWCLLSSGAARL